MLDLKKYKSPVHKVIFEEGDVFIKRLSTYDSTECDLVEDTGDRLCEMIARSLCDSKGKSLEYSAEDIKVIDTDLCKRLFFEIVDINKAKKKQDLALTK